MPAGKRVACAVVRATWVARLLLAASAGVCIAIGPGDARVRAQAPGSLGPSFELTDHSGKTFSSTALAGHPYADLLRVHTLP